MTLERGMMTRFEYFRPKSLQEGINFLADFGNETEILAGGTDLVVNLRQGSVKPSYVLDISRLDELKGIDLVDGRLYVGAGVTLTEIYESTLLHRYAPALQKCAASFASRQIRNAATIGGNVAHCSPCADTLPPLLIHEAEAVVTGVGKQMRRVPVQEVASGPYSKSLGPGEIIIRFILKPAWDANFADFQKIGRRKELATARISMACMIQRETYGKISFARFALGACTPVPQRMESIEEYLLGKFPDAQILWEAGGLVAEKMFEINGRRASAGYKEPAVRGLFFRMLSPLLDVEARS